MKLSQIINEQHADVEELKSEVEQAQAEVRRAEREDRGPGQSSTTRQRLSRAYDRLHSAQQRLKHTMDPGAREREASDQRLKELKGKAARLQQDLEFEDKLKASMERKYGSTKPNQWEQRKRQEKEQELQDLQRRVAAAEDGEGL